MDRLRRLGRMPGVIASIARASGVAAGILVAAGAAAIAQDDPVTLTFANWAAAESTTRPAIEQVIEDFEAAHPGIRIESEAISFSEIARQLVLRIRSGNPPDIAQLAGNDTALLATAGTLAPLDDYLDPDLNAKLKPDALSGLLYDGQLMAFPWTQAPAGFWYNKAVMEKAGLDPESPPETIDELMTAMAAVKRSQPDVIPLGLDTTNRAFAMQAMWPWMRAFGAEPVGGEDARADSPEMERFLSWMRELAQKGYIDPGRKIGEFRPLAAQDKVAFVWDQVLLQGVVQSTSQMSDEAFYERWGVTTQPRGASGQAYSFEGGHQLAMFEGGEQHEAAWTFIRYLATSPEAIGTYTIGPGASLPPLAAAPNDDLARELDTPIYDTFTAEIVPTLTTPPYGPDFAAEATAIMAGVQQAVTGSEPIDQIASSIQQQLDRL